LASGVLTLRPAVVLLSALLLCAALLALQLNLYALALTPIALVLAMSYPFMKRFMNYPQAILGIAFAWSIPMVYAQVQQVIPLQAWILFVSTVAWVIAYDTMYGMTDIADDLEIGLKSTAIAFGVWDRAIVFLLQMVALAGYLSLGVQWWAGLLALGLVGYQQWLIKDREPARCFRAFLNNNYFGLALVLGLL